MKNSINTDRPDFRKLFYKIQSEEKTPKFIDGCEVIWTDHVEPLLSTVKRLQEENEQLKHTCLMAFDNLSNGESNARYRHIEVLEALEKALKSSELNKEEQ